MTGLSVAFAFRTGLFNIGASGQIAHRRTLCHRRGPDTCSAPAAAPSTYASGRGLRRSPLGTGPRLPQGQVQRPRGSSHHHDELDRLLGRSTIRSPAYFKGPYLETESRKIPEFASLKVPWLTRIFEGSYVNLGLFVALAAIVVIAVILNRTVLG